MSFGMHVGPRTFLDMYNTFAEHEGCLFERSEFDRLAIDKSSEILSGGSLGLCLTMDKLSSVVYMVRQDDKVYVDYRFFMPDTEYLDFENSLKECENKDALMMDLNEKVMRSGCVALNTDNILAAIVALVNKYKVSELAYDPLNTFDLILRVRETLPNLKLVPIPKDKKDSSPVIKELYRLVKTGRIRFVHSEILFQQMSAANLYTDQLNHWYLTKSNRSLGFSSLIACIRALGSILENPIIKK